jgi:hypothetical protein
MIISIAETKFEMKHLASVVGDEKEEACVEEEEPENQGRKNYEHAGF